MQNVGQHEQITDKLKCRENKFNTGDLFSNRENYMAKTPPGDFKVTTSDNSLLSQQAVTSKGILVPYTNLQLNSYPTTQLNLFYSDNISFSIYGSQYVTRIPVHDLITNLRRMLVAKFFCLSHDEEHEVAWSQNPTVYKHSSFFKRKKNQGKLGFRSHFSSHLYNCALVQLCVTFYGP